MGLASVELEDGRFYFVLPLRNVGAGIAVLHAWRVVPNALRSDELPDVDALPPRSCVTSTSPRGEVGFWQAALRESTTRCAKAWTTPTPPASGSSSTCSTAITRAAARRHPLRADAGRRELDPRVKRHWRLDGVNPRD